MNNPSLVWTFRPFDELGNGAGVISSQLAHGGGVDHRPGRTQTSGQDQLLVRGIRDSLARCGLARTE